jgi:hypothetical protein
LGHLVDLCGTRCIDLELIEAGTGLGLSERDTLGPDTSREEREWNQCPSEPMTTLLRRVGHRVRMEGEERKLVEMCEAKREKE